MKEIYIVTSGEYAERFCAILSDNMKSYADAWPKENPNLGHVASYETYQPNNDILAKRFGIPCFTKEEI